MGNSSVLIASSAKDRPTWSPVAEKLDKRGVKVIPYEADKVASGEVDFGITIGAGHSLSLNYDGVHVKLGDLSAAWYRRPTEFTDEQEDKARQLSLSLERNAIQHALWDLIPEDRWLSSPRNIVKAERKLLQLCIAEDVGFNTPTTVVTNNWHNVSDYLPETIVYKPSYGMFYDHEGLKILYVTPLENSPKDLPLAGNPFPGFWQPFLNKSREWRITAIGERTFDAAIYTDEDAKDDWRRHQLNSDRVRFKAEQFPTEQKELCYEYLGRLGLKFGCFDFIEDYDGKITFLECNANGQYGWLEDELGFPIAQSIADELIRVARSQ